MACSNSNMVEEDLRPRPALTKCRRCECHEGFDLVVVREVMDNLKKLDANELVTVEEVVNGKLPKCYAEGDENSEKSAYESLGKSDDESSEECVDEVLGKSAEGASGITADEALGIVAEESLEKSAAKALGIAVDKALEEPAVEVLLKYVEKVLAQPVDEVLEKCVDESSEKLGEEQMGKSDDNPWLKTVVEPLGGSTSKALGIAVDQPLEKSGAKASGIAVDESKEEILGKSTKACNKRAVEDEDEFINNKRSCAGKSLKQLLEEGQSQVVLDISYYFPNCKGEYEAATCGVCYAKYKPKESMKAARRNKLQSFGRKKKQSLRKGIVNMYL